MIASAAADLRRYPASAAAYLQDGLPPNPPWGIKAERAPAAGPAQGDDGASRRRRARAISTRAIWRSSIAADVQAAGGALSVEDLAPFRAASARAAGDPLSRRHGVCDAGTHRRTDAGAYAAPAAAELAAGAQRTGCSGLRGLCLGAAGGLSRTPEGHGRRRRTARARRRSISRRPAPRISRWSTATATWRR